MTKRGVPVEAHREPEDGLVVDHVGIEFFVERHDAYFRAVKDATFTVPKGSFVSVIGPTGCGKSTVLRAIAGLVPYSDGEVRWNGKPIVGPGVERAVVFQAAALLPWRTVSRNTGYGLENLRRPKAVIAERVQEMLTLVGLDGYADRYPHELSGGMQQRVNLARALAVDPEVLLLDEPFSALDSQTRAVMGSELLRIWAQTRKTALLITHQIDEAVFLSDTVVVLSAGPASTTRHVIPIELPRPRTDDLRRTPEFTQIVDHIWSLTKEAWLKSDQPEPT